MQIIGFFRVTGFDHLVRFVLDGQPDQYGQRQALMQDGLSVRLTTALGTELLPLSELSDQVHAWCGKSERSEFDACNHYVQHNLVAHMQSGPVES
jgi:hypothetical protein